jgi:hypothetical protein
MMPSDEVLAGDTRAWLELAARHLRPVEILLAATPPDVEGALFHSQQTATLARHTSQLLKQPKLCRPLRRKCSKRSCFDYEKR